MKPTRPTPIISAAAVAEVRFGLRMAFSRASVPVMPRSRDGRTDHPGHRRAMIGPRTATPRNTATAPTPTERDAGAAEAGRQSSDAASQDAEPGDDPQHRAGRIRCDCVPHGRDRRHLRRLPGGEKAEPR